MDLTAQSSFSWPDSIALLGLMVFVLFLLGISLATWLEYRKTKLAAAQEDAVRQLVQRYEQLAANTLDAQQRVAADVSELRSRTAAIEQILRTVE
jgi:flagellar basal body-associated protein FliL